MNKNHPVHALAVLLVDPVSSITPNDPESYYPGGFLLRRAQLFLLRANRCLRDYVRGSWASEDAHDSDKKRRKMAQVFLNLGQRWTPGLIFSKYLYFLAVGGMFRDQRVRFHRNVLVVNLYSIYFALI
jgi:hypothetical protein